jgi:hypothetical protein
MQTIVPLGMLFLISAAGCSGSGGALTAPDEEIRPSVDPAGKQRQPRSPCDLPDSSRYSVSFSRSVGSSSEHGSGVEVASSSCARHAA